MDKTLGGVGGQERLHSLGCGKRTTLARPIERLCFEKRMDYTSHHCIVGVLLLIYNYQDTTHLDL